MRGNKCHHVLIILVVTVALLVLSQETVQAVEFGRDAQYKTALIGEDGLILNNNLGLRGVPAGGEVVNLKFTGTRGDISVNGDMRPNGSSRLETSGFVIYNKMGFHKGKSLRVIYNVDVLIRNGYDWYDAYIDGRFQSTPYNKNGPAKDFYVRSVRVEYEDGTKLPNNIYPMIPLLYNSYRQGTNQIPVSLLFNGGAVRLFASNSDRYGSSYGADLEVTQIQSGTNYGKIVNRADRRGTTIVAMLKGSNPASFGTAFPAGDFNLLSGFTINARDSNFIQLFPEDYAKVIIKDEPVASTDYEEMTIHTTFTQPLVENYYEIYYPLENTFKMELAYQHPELVIREEDYTVALGNGTQLQKDRDYTLTVDNQTVDIRLTREFLIRNAGEELIVTHEMTDISVDPNDNKFIDTYEEDGYKIGVVAQTSWETPAVNGAISSQKTNEPSEGISTMLYKPEVTGGENVTSVAINSQANELDMVKIAQDFTSSYPGDELIVNVDTPDMSFPKMGEYYDVPITISSKLFSIVKQQTIKVRAGERTSFTYKARRDGNTIRLLEFENRTDLTNRFSQMIIVTPDNVKLVERTLNGNIRVPGSWDQPTDIDGSANMRSYTFPKVSGNAYSQNIEAYLSDLSFEVVSDFDREEDIKVIFRETPILTAFDGNDPRNAATKADIPQKIIISGKNTAGDELYNKTIANNLMIGVERALEPETIQHYNDLPTANLAPRNTVTTHEFLYQAKEYQINYEANGGVGPVVPVQKYSILDAQTTLHDGQGFTRENYKFDSWIEPVTEQVYPVGGVLDKNNLPGNLTLAANWERNNVNATIKYLLLESNGDKTTKEVVENLTTGKRRGVKNVEMLIGTNISDGLPAVEEFAGYERVAQYEVFQEDLPYLSESVPAVNFEIRYYYKPTMTVTVPKNLNFGTRPMRKTINTYGLVAGSELKDNSISVINTHETTSNQPSWELYASTNGFYRENASDKLLAQLLFKHDGKSKIISSSSTKIVKEQTTYTDDIPLINREKDEGLFVQVANVQSVGKYNATLTIKLQRAP